MKIGSLNFKKMGSIDSRYSISKYKKKIDMEYNGLKFGYSSPFNKKVNLFLAKS